MGNFVIHGDEDSQLLRMVADFSPVGSTQLLCLSFVVATELKIISKIFALCKYIRKFQIIILSSIPSVQTNSDRVLSSTEDGMLWQI